MDTLEYPGLSGGPSLAPPGSTLPKPGELSALTVAKLFVWLAPQHACAITIFGFVATRGAGCSPDLRSSFIKKPLGGWVGFLQVLAFSVRRHLAQEARSVVLARGYAICHNFSQ